MSHRVIGYPTLGPGSCRDFTRQREARLRVPRPLCDQSATATDLATQGLDGALRDFDSRVSSRYGRAVSGGAKRERRVDGLRLLSDGRRPGLLANIGWECGPMGAPSALVQAAQRFNHHFR